MQVAPPMWHFLLFIWWILYFSLELNELKHQFFFFYINYIYDQIDMLLLCFTVLPLGSDVDILATSDPNVDKEEEGDTPIYDKYDKKLHGENKGKS